MINAKLYCDESGTTGTNWTDTEQPYFVYGGWLILDKNKEKVIEGIQDIFKPYQGTELKSKRFLKMGKSTHYFKKLFDFMLHNECFPLFTVTNKRYITAGKLVETFFDYAYNTALSSDIGWDFTLKKQLAEAIWKDDIIGDFSRLIKEGKIDLSKMVAIQEQLVTIFSSTKYLKSNLSNISTRELKEMIDEFNTHNTNRSLTIPILNQLMQLLQQFAEKLDFSVELIHDNIRGYDDWIAELKKIYLSSKEPKIISTDSFVLYSSMPNVTDIVFVDSKENILVQVSDLLCGFVSNCFKKLDKDLRFDENEKQFLESLFVLHDEFYCWDFVLPNTLLAKYLRAIGLSASPNELTNFNQVDMTFSQYVK